MSTTYPGDLPDTEWDCLQRYLLPLPRRGRPRTHPLRRILDAIFYVLHTGYAWRYLPSNFPPWQTVFYHRWWTDSAGGEQVVLPSCRVGLSADLRRSDRH